MTKTCGTPFLVVYNRLFQSREYPKGASPTGATVDTYHSMFPSIFKILHSPTPLSSAFQFLPSRARISKFEASTKYLRTWLLRRMYHEPRHQSRPLSVGFVYGKRIVYSCRTNGRSFLCNSPTTLPLLLKLSIYCQENVKAGSG